MDKKQYRIILKGDISVAEESDSECIIAGYASVQIPDKQGDILEVDVLKDALDRFMKNDKFRNVMFSHTSSQVGEVIPSFTDKSGKVYSTTVDDRGMFVVAKLRKDIELGRDVVNMIKEGLLKCFSIGGQSIQESVKYWGDKLVNHIKKLDLHEISIVLSGANPKAKFSVLKAGCNCEYCTTDILKVMEGEVDLSPSAEPIHDLIKEVELIIPSVTETQEVKKEEVVTDPTPSTPEKKPEIESEISSKLDKVLSSLETVSKSMTDLISKMCDEEGKYPPPKKEEVLEKGITIDEIDSRITKGIESALAKFEASRVEKKSEVPVKEDKGTLPSLDTFKTTPSKAWEEVRKLRWSA